MRVEPDCSGRWTCSQTASHSAIAAMTGVAEVLRVRAREADPLDPVDGVAGAQKLARTRSRCRAQVAALRVDVLAEQRDLAHALAREARRPRRRSRPGRRLCSRPRTAGTMQYEHVELQPIETCTQAWKRRSRCSGSSAGERALVAVPKRAARDAFAAGAEPLAEVRDRAGPERDVDVRVERRRAARAAPRRSSRRPRSRAPGSRCFSAPRLRRGGGEALCPASRGSCRC